MLKIKLACSQITKSSTVRSGACTKLLKFIRSNTIIRVRCATERSHGLGLPSEDKGASSSRIIYCGGVDLALDNFVGPEVTKFPTTPPRDGIFNTVWNRIAPGALRGKVFCKDCISHGVFCLSYDGINAVIAKFLRLKEVLRFICRICEDHVPQIREADTTPGSIKTSQRVLTAYVVVDDRRVLNYSVSTVLITIEIEHWAFHRSRHRANLSPRSKATFSFLILAILSQVGCIERTFREGDTNVSIICLVSLVASGPMDHELPRIHAHSLPSIVDPRRMGPFLRCHRLTHGPDQTVDIPTSTDAHRPGTVGARIDVPHLGSKHVLFVVGPGGTVLLGLLVSVPPVGLVLGRIKGEARGGRSRSMHAEFAALRHHVPDDVFLKGCRPCSCCRGSRWTDWSCSGTCSGSRSWICCRWR
mmetsp:Transcript_13289/g.20376  ORF Transcript_13289/g.20376 Transcript_13289/m.20376 type:complete len:416 (+) Transcript_13289:1209-2456(+)